MKKYTLTSLKIYLLQQGISQSRIAKDTGLSRSTINKLINHNEASKSVKVLVRLYLDLEQEKFNTLCETTFKDQK